MNFPETESAPAAETAGRPELAAKRFISFELGGELCCVAASGVAEVVHPMPVAALPNRPDWLLGLGAYRGEPVAVIDPATVAKPSGENRGKAKIIVFRPRPNEARFALPIDSLHEMILVPSTEDRPGNAYKGRPVTFVDHEGLIDGFGQGRN